MAALPQRDERITYLRNIDPAAVLATLGAARDRYDKAKWRIDDKIISVTGPLFYDHANERGGRGAIDLVMYVRDLPFREALGYLDAVHDSVPLGPSHNISKSQRADETRPFTPPRPVDEHWSHVRSYLLDERALPPTLIDALHEHSLIYADAHRNAVFLRQNESDRPTGAFLRGTHPDHPFKGLASGTERERGWFRFEAGDRGAPQLVLAESAIDALSYYALLHGDTPLAGSGAYREIYVSTDGAGALPYGLISNVLAGGGLVRVAFDRDERGERFWQELRERYSGVDGLGLWREAPAAGKDWNDLLTARAAHARDTNAR